MLTINLRSDLRSYHRQEIDQWNRLIFLIPHGN
jgi:hypothetical protein